MPAHGRPANPAGRTLHPHHTGGACLLGKAGRVRYYQAYEENARPLRRAISAQVKALAQRINPELPQPATNLKAPTADAILCFR